jgi:NADH dehydrogenase
MDQRFLEGTFNRLAVIFGGAGFIGRHLAPGLAAHGWAVRVAARHPPPRGSPAASDRLVWVAADLGHDDQVRRAVSGAHAVINLVGIAREHGQSFVAVNVKGAARVARLAAQAGAARLLHLSALGIAEDAPSAADRTKAQGEAAVREAFPVATLARPSLVYGSGDHFFGRFAALAARSPVLPVLGGGRTRFQPIHVADAVRALHALLEQPATAGTTFALVGPETFSFRELLAHLLAALGQRRLIVSLPFGPAEALAVGLERLSSDPPLTREEVRLLRTDKLAGGLPTPAELGIAARPLGEGLPDALRAGR